MREKSADPKLYLPTVLISATQGYAQTEEAN